MKYDYSFAKEIKSIADRNKKEEFEKRIQSYYNKLIEEYGSYDNFYNIYAPKVKKIILEISNNGQYSISKIELLNKIGINILKEGRYYNINEPIISWLDTLTESLGINKTKLIYHW